jgi:hypothetical protein
LLSHFGIFTRTVSLKDGIGGPLETDYHDTAMPAAACPLRVVACRPSVAIVHAGRTAENTVRTAAIAAA